MNFKNACEKPHGYKLKSKRKFYELLGQESISYSYSCEDLGKNMERCGQNRANNTRIQKKHVCESKTWSDKFSIKLSEREN